MSHMSWVTRSDGMGEEAVDIHLCTRFVLADPEVDNEADYKSIYYHDRVKDHRIHDHRHEYECSDENCASVRSVSEGVGFVEPLFAAVDIFSMHRKLPQELDEYLSNVMFEYEVRLLGGPHDRRSLPANLRSSVLVIAENTSVAFQVFDIHGNLMASGDERSLASKFGELEDFKAGIRNLWPPHLLSDAERDYVRNRVASLMEIALPEPDLAREALQGKLTRLRNRPTLPKPKWDLSPRKATVDGKIVKIRQLMFANITLRSYTRENAVNQFKILNSLETNGWAGSIANPLENDKENIKADQTVDDINKNLIIDTPIRITIRKGRISWKLQSSSPLFSLFFVE